MKQLSMRSITPAYWIPIFDTRSTAIAEIREYYQTLGLCGSVFVRGHISRCNTGRTIGIHTFGNPHLLESKKHFCCGNTAGVDYFCKFPADIVLVDRSGSEPTTLVVFLVRQFTGTCGFQGIAPQQMPVAARI
jgi:hypothetical protein